MVRMNELAERASFTWFPVGLTTVYACLELLNILHHSMWRDEIQVWMLGRHSHSIAELIYLKRYDGHPDAWFVLVYLITKFTHDLRWMQVVHAAVATATVYAIARYSPFTRMQKILMAFGYFLFFEYATISREYALGILGLFVFCSVFRSGPRKNYVALVLLLAFICQTSVYAMILALSLFVALAFEAIQAPDWRQPLTRSGWKISALAAIMLIAVGISVLHTLPPADGGFGVGVHLGTKGLSASLAMFWRSFVPIPQFTQTFWNSNLLQGSRELTRLMALMGVASFCASVMFFLRKPVVLFAYLSGATGLLLFKQFVYQGYLRHDGFVFILFLVCLWLASYFPEKHFPLRGADRIALLFKQFVYQGYLRHDGFVFILFLVCLWLASYFPEKHFPLRGADRIAVLFKPLQKDAIFTLLLIHAAVGIGVSAAAFTIPFSQAQAIAQYIRSNNMENWTIIGDPDYSVSSVVGYLDRESFYFTGNRVGSYIILDKRRLTEPTESVMQLASESAARIHQKVLVILNYPAAQLGPGVSEIASFQGAIVPDENFFLYLVQPPNPPDARH